MKNKIVLLLVSCFMVLSLVLASCAPAIVEEEEEAPPVVVEKEKPVVEEKPVVPVKEMVKDSLGRLVEKPRYGGTLTFIFHKSQLGWDPCVTNPGAMYRHNLVNDNLVTGDWRKGPIGANEISFQTLGGFTPEACRVGALAESWEYRDLLTMIFYIRKGVHWQNRPPVNGREFTADDVVFNLKRHYTASLSNLRLSSPEGHVPTSIKALDRYTVEVKCPDPTTAREMFDWMAMRAKMVPLEVIEKYGDMNDWHNVIGTGPFTVEDEVAGTSTIMVRSPNYWENDPLHPDNQLPYLDKIKWVIITDLSTRLAAMRTGKCDVLQGLSLEQGDIMLQHRPSMQYSIAPFIVPYAIQFRMDKPEVPWADKRVRHALALAMDNELIKRDYYQGRADILSCPVVKITDTKEWYIPLEQLPKETQELYEYHPDKAKQLLIEAGYSDGFDVRVLCTSRHVDLLSIFKDMWAKIGVNLLIDVREHGVYSSILGARGYPEAWLFDCFSIDPLTFARVYMPGAPGNWNRGLVDDPKVNENAAAIRAAYCARDRDECVRLMQEIQPYIIDQMWQIQPPNYHRYVFLYQPWVNQFDGAYTMGPINYYRSYRYIWIDEDLKEGLGY